MNIVDVPFNQHLRLATTQRAGAKTFSLEPRSFHLNHVGTIHAGVVYSVAEAASAQALLDLPSIDAASVIAVVRSANIKYRQPAEGRIHGNASIADEIVHTFNARMASKGRALITINAEVVDDRDQQVLSGQYTWFVSKRDKINEA